MMCGYGLYLLNNLGKVYNDREVVAISVEPTTLCVCTLGIAFIFAAVLAQEVFVENLRFEVFQCRAVFTYKIARNDYLVKQVPFALVAECAEALVKEFPHCVEVAILFRIFLFLHSTKYFAATLVVGVVVQVGGRVQQLPHDGNAILSLHPSARASG